MNSILLPWSLRWLVSASLLITPLIAAELSDSKSAMNFDLSLAQSSAENDLSASKPLSTYKDLSSSSAGHFSASEAAQAAGIKQQHISPHATGNQYRKSIDIQNSVYTDRISFITQNDKKRIVIKYYRMGKSGSEGYEKDKTTFDQDNKLINEYTEKKDNFLKANSSVKLPILTQILGFSPVKFKGDTIYVEYMEAASGETIREYIDTVSENNFEEYKNALTEIGKQFGNIYRMYNEHRKNNATKHSLVHPDSNDGNFIFDKKTNQLFWIDLSEIRIDENYDDKNGFKRGTELNNLVFAKDILIVLYKVKTAISKLNEKGIDEKKELLAKAKRIIQLHQAFFHGYKSVVDPLREHPLTIQFVFQQNNSEYNNDYHEDIGYFWKYSDFEQLINVLNSWNNKTNGITDNFLRGYE